jgi:uncharacterized lipoprotein YehR (DUF1307 family)
MDINEKTIQIVAFTTNFDPNQFSSPYEIIKIFLKYHDHILLKQRNGLALAFKTTLPKSKKETQIMICSVYDLFREYNGIKEVNCYLLFVDLESKDSKNQLDLIIKYFLKYCSLSKKIYIIGIYNSDSENIQKYISEQEIKEIFENSNIMKIMYKEMNIEDTQKISDYILDIFVAVENIPTKRKISQENKENCLIF